MPDHPLLDRIAVVTGGESGIGESCVTALAAAGAHVGLTYFKDAERGRASAETARARGRKAISVRADVGVEPEVDAAFDAIGTALGVPDILINSAGINMSGVEVVDMSLDQWERMLRTDLTGSFLTSRRFLRDLLPTGRPGAIVNITSIHAFAMRAGGADYDAAKGGQRNLTRTLALEVAQAGVTVNAIAPGMILTPMNEKAIEDEEYRRKLEAQIPIPRAGRADEVAGLAVFLASPAASYITGASIVIDGGLSLMLGQGA
jgi:glucose 1-dehydrogenase